MPFPVWHSEHAILWFHNSNILDGLTQRIWNKKDEVKIWYAVISLPDADWHIQAFLNEPRVAEIHSYLFVASIKASMGKRGRSILKNIGAAAQ